MKKREEKWAANNKEKKHLMDKYLKNIKVIDDAFNQIKEKTGIESNDEIVTTFIKSEEQTYSLYNYVNALNSDIDTIEEANNNIWNEIEKLNIMNMSEKEREDHIKKLQNDLVIWRSKMDQEEKEMNKKEENMNKIQDAVHWMQEAFKWSNIPLYIATPMQYDSETQFNVKNAS